MQIALFKSCDYTLSHTPHLKRHSEFLTISAVSGIDKQTAILGANDAYGRKQQ